ncbi:MAG: hypothetical protein R3F34_06695 [Planctomycetota bacterium]
MKTEVHVAALAAFLLPALPTCAFAQDASDAAQGNDAARIDELERRIDLLAEELEAARLGSGGARVGEGKYGLGAAASRVYHVPQGVSIGGYGELSYVDVMGGDATLDLHRAILYFGYRFDDHWLVNSEFEFEHATIEDTNDGSGDTAPGEVSVEFAYVEYQHDPTFGARAGLMLVPMGFVNELHEPNAFLSADRPFVEQRILPSTWRENGVGVFGECDCGLSWRVYAMAGLDASGFSSNGIRGGRQQGGQSSAEDLAIVARVDQALTDGLTIGASGYHGRTGQTLSLGARTTILEGHFDWRMDGFRARGLYARTEVDDVAELNAALGLAGADSIGDSQDGYYVELGYDLLHGKDQSLVPFVRYEALDTQKSVPTGFAKDPSRDREYLVFGASWSPIPEIVVKADYVDADDGAGGAEDLVRLTLGWVF